MSDWLQIALYLVTLVLLSRPLGLYIARVMEGESTFLSKVIGPVEGLIYRLCGIKPESQQTWKGYATSVLSFSFIGFAALYGIQRLQGFLPLNPVGQKAVSPDLAFSTASSFVTNTNWQSYGGETTMSYLTQMLGMSVQNFLSATTGIAIVIALIRGIRARESSNLGNFWTDMTRSVLYILIPLSLLLSLILVSQGVVQTFKPSIEVKAALSGPQTIAVGPAASQVAIKQLGTNGGGFFNTNSAHPLENPTPVSNFLSCLAILLIPAALCWTFGQMVNDKRQGLAVFAAMTLLLLLFLIPTVLAEQSGNPTFHSMGLASNANWEGKEMRIGIGSSGLWAAATTAASNGSVNSMHDSFTPLGGLFPMVLMQLGEVVFGGVGSGLYGMLVFAIVTVFIAGLMVGRTPEYLGKKIEPFEMKMASLVVLIPCVLVLVGTALSLLTGNGQSSMSNPSAHGFSELLYNYSSMGNNNGSAFAGFNANVPFHNYLGAILMWISRFWLAIPVLAIAGSLARKKTIPVGPGTLPTHTPLFVALLVSTVLIVGALTFIPALALGPIAEHLSMLGGIR